MKTKRYGSTNELFESALTVREKKLLSGLNSPHKIQLFLDNLSYAKETVYRSPLRVLREKTCQCFDGAVFAATMLYRIGYPALIIDLIPNRRDDDHVLALFNQENHWGAVAKSNFAGLRFREPIYRDVHELVMSYFEHYYNIHREKTLRGYTKPLNLKAFERCHWMTQDETMHLISKRLDRTERIGLLTRSMISRLSHVDTRSYKAGLLGSNKAGLSKPQFKKSAK